MDQATFGYWVWRQRKALDLTQAALAHRVGCATVTIKKIEREMRRPSRAMAERLAEVLAIPELERAAFVQSALGFTPADAFPLPTSLKAPYPSDRANSHPHKVSTGLEDRFVARQHELDRLEGQLQRVISGEGQVAFIAGGAGRGKTALALEFARRAVEAHPDLIVSGGFGSAFAGVGDPYLPFRETLRFLTGEIETHWLAKTVSQKLGHRIWQSLPDPRSWFHLSHRNARCWRMSLVRSSGLW